MGRVNDRNRGYTPGNVSGIVRQICMDDDIWTVYERQGSLDRRAGSSLIFESRAAVRRVRDFPSDWHQLGDEELARLSWRR